MRCPPGAGKSKSGRRRAGRGILPQPALSVGAGRKGLVVSPAVSVGGALGASRGARSAAGIGCEAPHPFSFGFSAGGSLSLLSVTRRAGLSCYASSLVPSLDPGGLPSLTPSRLAALRASLARRPLAADGAAPWRVRLVALAAQPMCGERSAPLPTSPSFVSSAA